MRICCRAQGNKTRPVTTWRGGWGWVVGGKLKREGTYLCLWLIHVDVWQKPTQYCRAIILQLIFLFLKRSSQNSRKSDEFPLFSSVTQLCPTLCEPIDSGMPGFPVHHQLPELAQTHFHQVSDAIQPSHPLSSPSPPAFNLSQHQGLFQWVSSLHQVAKVLEFQLQHQSFQWIFRTDFL